MKDILPYILILIILVIIIVIIYLIIFKFSLHTCPEDKLLVIFGNVGKDSEGNQRTAIILHPGNRTFIWPIIQNYAYLDLTPFKIEIHLNELECVLTIKISEEEEIKETAAELYLGLTFNEIKDQVQDYIHTEMRTMIPSKDHYNQNELKDKLQDELRNRGLELLDLMMK